MKISCPSCSAKYSLADEKVVGRLAKIRCRKCGTSIIIDGHIDPPSVSVGDADAPTAATPAAAVATPAAAPAVAETSASYTIDFGESDQRPMTMQEIIEAYNAGNVTAETYVWSEGFSDWTALGQVEAIVTALNDAANAGATPDETSAISASTGVTETPWQEQPAAGGADLFGTDSSVSTSAAAQVPAAGLSASATPEPSAPTASESSVLFSLSALTSQATNSRPSMPAQSTSRTNEDSGLIDLKALTEAAAHHQANAAAAPAAPVAAAVSPLGASPLGASPATTPAPAKATSKGPMFIGLGIAVAAICGTIIFVSSKDEPVTAPPAPVAAPIAPVKKAPASAALPAPLPAADEDAEKKKADEAKAAAEAEEKKKAAEAKKAPTKKTYSKPASKKTVAKTPAAKPKSAPPKKAPPKKKAVSKKKCPCKSDDFLCIMKKCK